MEGVIDTSVIFHGIGSIFYLTNMSCYFLLVCLSH